jgi:hypothetical protein
MDYRAARSILINFSEASKQKDGNYAFVAGYYESVILELLDQVSPAECMRLLSQIEQSTKAVAQEHMIETLKD